jgi:toxin ParE1/3/4
MKYTILRTDKANDQLFDLVRYIADDSGSIDIAMAYLEKLENTILQLETSPHMGSFPRYSILKKQGYRVLIIERHLVFYKTDDEKKTVTVYAVVDGRQEYKSLI